MAEPFWPVVEEHLNEAEYLSWKWEDALDAPDFGPRIAARWEERLVAQLDGLATACPQAMPRLLDPALESEEPSRVLAAAQGILHSDVVDGVARIVERLLAAEASGPLSRALCLSPRSVEKHLGPLLSSSTPLHRAWALAIHAFHQSPASAWLEPFLESDEAAVASAALRVARYSWPLADRWCRKALEAEDLGLREVAVEVGLLAGVRDAWAVAQRSVDEGRLRSDIPLLVLAMSGEMVDVDRLGRLLEDESERAAALFALSFSGRRRAVELSLPFLGDPQLAHLAGEVVTAVVGLRMKDEFCLTVDEEKGEESSSAPLANVGPEGRLPVPNPPAVEAWWKTNEHRFEAGRRYLGGQPYGGKALVHGLANGPMRRRHVLALEASIRTGGRFRMESRGWLSSQGRAAAALPAMLSADTVAPFGRLLK